MYAQAYLFFNVSVQSYECRLHLIWPIYHKLLLTTFLCFYHAMRNQETSLQWTVHCNQGAYILLVYIALDWNWVSASSGQQLTDKSLGLIKTVIYQSRTQSPRSFLPKVVNLYLAIYSLGMALYKCKNFRKYETINKNHNIKAANIFICQRICMLNLSVNRMAMQGFYCS